MHAAYGGVVPRAGTSRDHIRRVLPLMREVLDGGLTPTYDRLMSSPTRAARALQARFS